ncbi:MAG: DMT family transporter [Cellvibrionaceae bacterium]
MQNETKGMLYGLIAVSAFALTLPMTRVIVPYMDPVFIGLGRALVASFLAITLLLFLKQERPSLKQVSQLIIVALGVVIGFPVLSSWAMQYVPASHGGVVLGILPLATAVIGVVIGNERPSLAFWVVGIVGSAIVVLYALLQGAGSIHVADFALLGAVFSAATGYAFGARLAKTMGGWQVICWAHILALPFILLPALSRMPESLTDIPFYIYANFLYLALISQFFAFFVWYKGLVLGGIARVSQTQLLQPVITLLASILFLKEVIDSETFVFIFLVLGSVWISKKMPIREKLKKADAV